MNTIETANAITAAAMRTITALEIKEMDAATGLAIGMSAHAALRAQELITKTTIADRAQLRVAA